MPPCRRRGHKGIVCLARLALLFGHGVTARRAGQNALGLACTSASHRFCRLTLTKRTPSFTGVLWSTIRNFSARDQRSLCPLSLRTSDSSTGATFRGVSSVPPFATPSWHTPSCHAAQGHPGRRRPCSWKSTLTGKCHALPHSAVSPTYRQAIELRETPRWEVSDKINCAYLGTGLRSAAPPEGARRPLRRQPSDTGVRCPRKAPAPGR